MRTILLGLLLICLFFFRQLFGGEVWYCCDNLLINIPARMFQKEAGFALTNPYIFSGAPFLADINLAPFYPGNIIFWLFNNPFRALTISIIFHFFVAFVGMYVLTRSIVAAIVFTFSGTLVTYTNNLPMLQVAVLLPWVLWAWRRNFALFVLFASLQIFAGHVQFTFYTWLLLFAWSLVFPPKNKWTAIGSIALVALATSIQVVPFLRLAHESTRLTFGYEYSVFDSLNPLSVVRLIIPWSIGILNDGTAWAMGGSVYGYVGVLPLLLILFAPPKKPVVRFFLIVAGVSFILALGKYTPLYPIVYKIIPGLGNFRSPQHFLLIWTFAVSILAGHGANKLWRTNLWLFLGASTMVCIAIASLVFGADLVVLNAGISAIILSLLYKFRTKFIPCFLLCVDLFLFTRSNVITLPQSTVSSWFEKSEVLARTISSGGRIFVHKDLYEAPIKKQFGTFDWPEAAAWQVAILRPNINMLYHIPSIDGYASIVSGEYQSSFGVPATDPTGVHMGYMTGEKLIERGVDTVLAPQDPKYIRELYPLELTDWLEDIAIYRLIKK